MSHAETVKAIYQAFGQGDVPAILERLAEDVEWEYGAGESAPPWLTLRRGRSSIVGFFESLGALDIHRFEPKRFLEDGPLVVAVLDFECTVRQTGRRIVEEDQIHLWHFDSAGRVARFRHRTDTHQQWAAYFNR
ncbi:MAG: nuclear transport factor 2 family protein [Acidobacteria bacterium]|nr:nuclear transport factor 2 family protein [Acidobacteriota bacterium]